MSGSLLDHAGYVLPLFAVIPLGAGLQVGDKHVETLPPPGYCQLRKAHPHTWVSLGPA
jgi:hypothetical protein